MTAISSDRFVEVRERSDGKWDWHVIARANGEEVYGTQQGYTDADDAERALQHELDMLHVDLALDVRRVRFVG